MKLTDEQNKELDFWLEENMLVGDELTLDQIKLIRSMRSSEQAWREEAERLSRERETFVCLLPSEVRIWETQLNQAIEVLKWIAECGTDYQSIQRARDFLSSLQEDKLPAPPEST